MHQTPNAIAMKAQHHAWVRNKYKSSGYKNWIGKASSATPQLNHAVHIPVSPKFFCGEKGNVHLPSKDKQYLSHDPFHWERNPISPSIPKVMCQVAREKQEIMILPPTWWPGAIQCKHASEPSSKARRDSPNRSTKETSVHPTQ